MYRLMFCCARKLGIECLKYAYMHPDIEIMGVNVPESGWWLDIDDKKEVEKLNLLLIDNISEYIKAYKPDFVFSILTDYIFKKRDIENTKKIFNLHPAPLPYYRGCNSYAHAILNKETHYGVTLHEVVEKIDAGNIIAEDWFNIEPDWTGKDLYEYSQERALKLFKRWFRFILDGRYEAFSQDENSAHYYDRHSLIKLKNRGESPGLYDIARALEFYPFEPAYLIDEGMKIYLKTKPWGE